MYYLLSVGLKCVQCMILYMRSSFHGAMCLAEELSREIPGVSLIIEEFVCLFVLI